MLLLPSFTAVLLLSVSVPASVLVVAVETVVGVAGEAATLPCRSDAAGQSGVEVCWGRGQPALFTCSNTVINGAGDQVTYRRSDRFSVSSSSSLSISESRPSDSGFYHCRVQLPGLFNDQTSSVHLIIVSPRAVISEDGGNWTRPEPTGEATEKTGSDVTGGSSTEPMVAPVQSHTELRPVNTLQTFLGSTLRLSFIIFIPALLAAVYRVWRTNQRPETDGRLDQSEEEDGSAV